MAEPAAPTPTQAAEPAPAAPAVETVTETPTEEVSESEDSPFPEGTLAKRPDLAAKYGKNSKGKAAETAKGDASEDKGDGGTTTEPAATEAKAADEAPSKIERALGELRDMLKESPEALEFIEKLAKQKNLAGPFIELKKRSAQFKKKERQIEQREQTLAATQRELHDAVESFKADPKGFARRNGYDFRKWLAEQVADENLSPEAKRIRELETKQEEQAKEAAELKAWKAEVAEREKQVTASEADRGALERLEGYLASDTEQEAFPNVFAAFEPRDIASGVWNKIKSHYLETGIELDWRQLLKHEDDRLRSLSERLSRKKDSRASNGSSERATGSRKANPAGKQEPNSLSNADASERVSEVRPPKNREEHLDNVLAKFGIS